MEEGQQRFMLSMDSSKPDADEEVSMHIEIDMSCSLNFMTNAFVQLMKNEDKVKTAILMASTYMMLTESDLASKMKDLSDVDEIINNVINKK